MPWRSGILRPTTLLVGRRGLPYVKENDKGAYFRHFPFFGYSRTKFVFLILGSILPIAAGSLMFAEPRDLGTLDRLTTVWFPKNLNELFELNL